MVKEKLNFKLKLAYGIGQAGEGMFGTGLSFFLLFYYDVRLALIATVLAAIAILVSCALAYLHLHYERLIAAQEGRLMGQLLQLLEGVAKIRVAGAEKRAFAQWAQTFSKSQGMSVRLGMWENHFSVPGNRAH